MDFSTLVYGILAVLCAGLIAFTSTPSVRVLAFKLGAIDIPKDNRRMHKVPIPRLGGLAIFFGFTITTVIFCDISPMLKAIWLGGSLIVIVGVLDDIFRLKAIVKLIAQLAISLIPIWQGITISSITLAGKTISFSGFTIPITILWVVGLTNAINLIDGLDGLSCGVSAISAGSLLVCSILLGQDPSSTLLTAVLLGSCLGFLPFNTNPANIFMGDTGALFLGYTLSVISIGGVLKAHTVVAFIIPLSIFALPIFDTMFAIFRRLLHGKSPFEPDRGHLHHRLIDMGLTQKQSVAMLYSICGILGLSAALFTSEKLWRAGVTIIVGFALFITNFVLLKNPKTKNETGFDTFLAGTAKNSKPSAEEEKTTKTD